MATKRLVPYSVHLPEDIYNKLKQAAGDRKASALVRDAITLITDGGDQYVAGYNKGIRDAMATVESCTAASIVAIHGVNVSKHLSKTLRTLLKEKQNGNKKKGS